MPTIRQVAQACGVSPMTVSFVLNNRAGEVSPETRARVLKIVREMGYRPRAAEPCRTDTLGVVAGSASVSLIDPGPGREILQALLGSADSIRQHLTLFASSLFHSDAVQSVRAYCDGRCDGLLVVLPTPESPVVVALNQRGFPFVVVGEAPDEATYPSVWVGARQSMRALTGQMVSLGHRRSAFLGGMESEPVSGACALGFQQAMAEAGVLLNPAFLICPRSGTDDAWKQASALLSLPTWRRPTAILCWSAACARGLISRIQAMGLRVPEDISVAAFGDDLQAEEGDPSLSRTITPYRLLAQESVRLLLTRIRTEDPAPQRIQAPGDVVLGSTSARPFAQQHL